MLRSLSMIAPLLVAACGGAPPPAAAPPAPAPPAPQAPVATCAAPTPVTVESCVVGGEPDDNGQAVTSCTTSCQAAPPANAAAQECDPIGPLHFRCMGYAP